jgi:2',3'-cyclic-nucleotide 2'-phosphodiesterase (5'-nucleotidase family)
VAVFRKITTVLIYLTIVLSFHSARGVILRSDAAAAAAETAGVTILHTNDIHSHLTPFDMPGTGKNLGGSARHYEFIKKVRSETPDALLLDAGDIFQGTPFYTFFKGEADIKIFSLLGYDATTLGNHDLDDGLDNLLKQLKHASFPMLCANVFYKDNDKPVFESHKIIRRGGVNIALMGAIGKTAWDVIPAKLLEKIYITDEKKTIFALAERLKKEADLVVLLSHLGYEPDLDFTKSAKNIDVVVGGHTNTMLMKPHLIENGAENGIGGTLILQGFKWGVYIGRLDIELDVKAKKIRSYNGALNLIDSNIAVDESSPVSLLIKDYEKKMGEQVNVKLGVCETEMPYGDDEKHKRDLPLGILICDILKKAGGSDIAIINSGGIRDMMPAGDITIATTLKILPFDNSITTMELKGANLVDILNFIAGKYGEISGYQFDSGVSFTLDLKAKKARDIKINGSAVESDKIYRLSTISYMAEGNQNGDKFFKNAVNVKDNGFYLRDAMIEYIKNAGTIKAPQMRVMNVIE